MFWRSFLLTITVKIGLVQREEVQFGVTAFFASQGRAQAVELSVIIDYAENNFFIKNPGRDVGGVFGFMSGFRADAWIACSVLLLALPVLLGVFYFVLQRSDLPDNTSWTLGWNFFVFSAAIAQQVTSSVSVSWVLVTSDKDSLQFTNTIILGGGY